jgi:simple sugar transport system substrate-binding protein
MKRRFVLQLGFAVLSAALLWACGDNSTPAGGGGSTPSKGADAGKKPLTIGFAQTGAESGWRTANTISIQEEAKKRGIDLKFSDAQGNPDNQKKAISSFIAQKVDVIMFAPIVSDGWDPILKDAKDASIPVIISDRTISSPESLYTCFIGSDFKKEGVLAGEWLVKATSGKAKIAELQGTVGSAPATDRKKGFEEAIKGSPGMEIIMSQTGEFTRAKGKEVMEAFLKSPKGGDITVVFAHNDDMAIGAIQAIKDAGKKPGKDIMVLSIDGMGFAFDAILAGELNCTVECNPLLGPPLFDAAEKVVKGETVPRIIYSHDDVYDASNVTPEVRKNRKY